MENVVIVGASHAATEAISSLRKLGWAGGISLIGDEPDLPYQRPPLSKAYYQGDMTEDKLSIKNAKFYDNAQVDCRIGQRVSLIDRPSSEVVLSQGERLAYSKLILATGARARLLPVPGAEAANVMYLRTKADVDLIKQRVGAGNKLLIVGAGYIGLELAASAVKQGVEVVILEAQERVLARVTSPVISDFFEKVHVEAGVDLRLGVSLTEFEHGAERSKAKLADGSDIEFDCAVVGIGVMPNIEIAEQAGLLCDDGIVVNEFAATQDANIFAVGDCSNHPSLLYQRRLRLESVPNAVGQAKTAALAICNQAQAYNQLPWFWSDQYDIKMQTAGLFNDYDNVSVDGDIQAKKFSVSYFKGGQLIALDAINSPAEFMKAKKKISAELA